jgi:protein phosphatase PTC2/3
LLLIHKHAFAGDSRAVVAQRRGVGSGPGAFVAKDLSIDQNPNSPLEQKRIEASGGFVSPPPEPGLSARVWLDREMTQIGLAMARSIGDHAVKNIGVIAGKTLLQYCWYSSSSTRSSSKCECLCSGYC